MSLNLLIEKYDVQKNKFIFKISLLSSICQEKYEAINIPIPLLPSLISGKYLKFQRIRKRTILIKSPQVDNFYTKVIYLWTNFNPQARS